MIITRPEFCPQNHRCPSLSVCPVGAIKQEGFNAPTIDQSKCISCGACPQSCRVFQEIKS